MWGGHEHEWGWTMIFGMYGMVLFWIFAIVAIVALVKWLAGGVASGRHATDNTALRFLKERYARGEIGREEFMEKRRELQS